MSEQDYIDLYIQLQEVIEDEDQERLYEFVKNEMSFLDTDDVVYVHDLDDRRLYLLEEQFIDHIEDELDLDGAQLLSVYDVEEY